MKAKDAVIETAKQIVAELVRDGKLAEEGARQTSGTDHRPAEAPAKMDRLSQKPSQPTSNTASRSESSQVNEDQFASLLGLAALKVWPDLPRDAQERLFAAAVDDGVIANALAEFLHDRHPRTAHPPKPTRIA